MSANIRGLKQIKQARLINQKRSGYAPQQQHFLGTFIVATVAAVMVHIVLYYTAPMILDWKIVSSDTAAPDEEEVYRVVTLPTDEDKVIDIPTPDEIPELKEIEPQAEEIDILDVEQEELVLAPGDTNLGVPQLEAETVDALELSMDDSSHAQMLQAVQATTSETLSLPEPTPLNENDVIVQAQASMSSVDTSDLLSGELLAQVEDRAALPSDTRSLSELLKVKQLGANSGVARLGADVLFAFDENKLRNSARIPLIQLAALIRKNPNTNFVIEGHTDSFGSTRYNEKLSLRRAAAVRDWLAKNHIPLYQVYIRACGNTRPLAERDGTRQQQALNRRVEIHMRRPSEPLPSGCLDAHTEVAMKDD